MARLIENVEGIDASEWEYFQVVRFDDNEVDYEVYGHTDYEVIELEVDADGGWCVYIRWGVDGDEMAFMTLDEAKEWLESEDGTDARVWGLSQAVPDRE